MALLLLLFNYIHTLLAVVSYNIELAALDYVHLATDVALAAYVIARREHLRLYL